MRKSCFGEWKGTVLCYQNRVVSIKHNLIYSLITIRLAMCFDPTGSSSDLLNEPVNVRKLRTFLGSQQCLQR